MSTNLRDQLRSIYDAHGELTPRAVVNEARVDGHPLHSRFEWDDAVAGERFRESQAADLIRSVRVVYREADGQEPERSTRYWQSVRQQDGFVYRPSEEIAQDPVATQVVLMDMRREWKSMQARYGRFQEFIDMVRTDTDEAAS